VAQKGEDRRASPRFQCSGDAEMRSLSSGIRAVGKIENLSLGGCLIHLANQHGFRKGETVEMTFTIRQLPLRVQASVRQLHSDAAGVAFTLLSERGRRQLQLLIDELSELLRDQVEGLTQFRSSLAGSPSEATGATRPIGQGQKDPAGAPSGPVPIDRKRV